MNVETQYQLTGFVKPLAKTLGFLTPIFEANGSFYVQEVDESGCIERFLQSRSPHSNEFVPCPTPKAFNSGYPAVHALALSESEILFGDKKSLSKKLEGKIEELNEHQFVKLDVLRFLGRQNEYASAINSAAEKLEKIDPRLAASWKRNTEHQFIPRPETNFWLKIAEKSYPGKKRAAKDERNELDDFENTIRQIRLLEKFLADEKQEPAKAKFERKAADLAEIKERQIYIKNPLSDFVSAHLDMAQELRADLAKFKSDLHAAEDELKKADQADVKERRAAVKNMPDEFRKEFEEAAAAWRGLLADMASVRKADYKRGPVEEAIEEGEEGHGNLKDRVLDVLEDNPDGLRMVEIADTLDIPDWRSLIPVMKELVEKGEIVSERKPRNENEPNINHEVLVS